MTQLTICRLIVLFLLPWLVLLAACKDKREALPDRWQGVPEAALASLYCKWRDGVGVCVGGGEAYQCLSLGTQTNETHRWDAYACARVSAAILPEKEKEE